MPKRVIQAPEEPERGCGVPNPTEEPAYMPEEAPVPVEMPVEEPVEEPIEAPNWPEPARVR